MKRYWMALACGLGAFTVVPMAGAADCTQEIGALAREYSITMELPRTEAPLPQSRNGTEEPAVRSEDLARSGGVIAPPSEGQGRVIRPPETGAGATPTMPTLPPQTGERLSRNPVELGASERAQIQALLQAAKAADEQGQEAACFERLTRAKEIAGAR
jgi:hypothetical protein